MASSYKTSARLKHPGNEISWKRFFSVWVSAKIWKPIYTLEDLRPFPLEPCPKRHRIWCLPPSATSWIALQAFCSPSSSADCHDGQSNNPSHLHNNSAQIQLQKEFLEGKPSPGKVIHSYIFCILCLFYWTAVHQSWIFPKLCTQFMLSMHRSCVRQAWKSR